jgi:hypothetical protein
MDTNPNSKAETLSDESKDEFLEQVVLRKNKRGMVEVTRFQAFEENAGRGWLTFESRPDDADMWELVYYSNDPEHVPLTLAMFDPKRLSEIEGTHIALDRPLRRHPQHHNRSDFDKE